MTKFFSFLATAACAASLAGAAAAQQDHSHHAHQAQAKAQDAKPSTVKVRYDDAQLTDADGRTLRLKSDVIGERVVVMDFVYTTCTTICPVLSALMAQVQGELSAPTAGPGPAGPPRGSSKVAEPHLLEGGQPADDVRLVTISVDPARDTPARLKEYSARFGAKPGWVWLTGPTGRVNEVLKGFGAYTPNFEDHPPLVLVGDARSGQWTRFYGFADPKQVTARVRELRAARAAGMHAGHKH